MVGDLIGNDLTSLTFTYAPTTFTTADCEFLIKTSEFDFVPQIVRVLGSATP
jgi:hypothetical protein